MSRQTSRFNGFEARRPKRKLLKQLRSCSCPAPSWRPVLMTA